jgi:hypothetical protein
MENMLMTNKDIELKFCDSSFAALLRTAKVLLNESFLRFLLHNDFKDEYGYRIIIEEDVNELKLLGISMLIQLWEWENEITE